VNLFSRRSDRDDRPPGAGLRPARVSSQFAAVARPVAARTDASCGLGGECGLDWRAEGSLLRERAALPHRRHLGRCMGRLKALAMSKTLLICLCSFAVLSTPLGAGSDESGPQTQSAQQPQEEITAEQSELAPVPCATPTVEKLHTALIGIMKNAEALGYDGRYAQLTPVVEETFDLPFMASKSVGRHWKKLADQEQVRWTEAFRRLTTASYAGRFEGYSGESFETHAEERAIHDTMMVHTTLLRPGDEDVQLNYRLRRVGDTCKIIDIYLDGTVSELALRRSEYSTVLKREGFEELVSTLNGRIAELAKGSAS
jgi:phospholipid transport system substrate-binding protein